MKTDPRPAIAGYIDHTVLKATTSFAETDRCCAEAKANGFAAVCIPPFAVARTAGLLKGSAINTATVIGFPLGYSATAAKEAECRQAISDGAKELDVVVNLMALKAGDWNVVEKEIIALTRFIHQEGRIIKVIVESGLLSDAELLHCCRLLGPAGIDFMKTSTGFAEKGASVTAVETMRHALPASVQIKASGGIRTYAFASELVAAGATRIGCSASVQILAEEKQFLQTETTT